MFDITAGTTRGVLRPGRGAAIETATERLREYLRARKLRLTPERLVLLRAVLDHPGHFDADQIVARLKRRRGRAASRATVYRTLVLLEECGILRRSLRGQGRAVYEEALGRGPHNHIVCASCGRVEEFYEKEVERLQDEIAGRLGFQVTEHVNEIVGLCGECSGSRKRSAANPEARKS
jgi:Fur family ferric uptake transcriptional regulator